MATHLCRRHQCGGHALAHRADLQQGAEGRAADGAVARLVAQVVGAAVAEAEVATGQDERVARLAHADDALAPAVLHLVLV